MCTGITRHISGFVLWQILAYFCMCWFTVCVWWKSVWVWCGLCCVTVKCVSSHVTGKLSGKLAYSSWINGKTHWVLLFLSLSQPRPAVLHQSCHQTQWVVCFCPAQLDLVCCVCSVRCLHVSLVFVLVFFVGNCTASRTSSQSDHLRERRSVALSFSLCLFRCFLCLDFDLSFNNHVWYLTASSLLALLSHLLTNTVDLFGGKIVGCAGIDATTEYWNLF